MIRKCLTVSPSTRFTVDDIVTHWWVNLGYKYPPVHYYLPPNMPNNHTMNPSHPPPVLTYNAAKRTSSLPGDKPKSTISLTPMSSQPPPPPPPPPAPVVAPLPQVQNERLTDTESKHKSKTNGHHPTKETSRLNDNKTKSKAPATTTATTTSNQKTEISKPNQASRWSLNKKQNNGVPSKNPPTRAIVH